MISFKIIDQEMLSARTHLTQVIEAAALWLEEHGIESDREHVVANISETYRALKMIEKDQGLEPVAWVIKARGYPAVRAEYKRSIMAAMDDYLTSQDKATAHKSAYKRAANEAFPEAFYIGYEESSGSREDVDPDADEWLTARMNEEIDYIDQLFVSLKQLRDQFTAGDIKAADLRDEVKARAEGYLNSLDIVYNTGRLYGKKNLMLTMVGDDGAESCDDCRKRKGKRYSARKWLAIGFPPSRSFQCRGYRCEHYLEDDEGNPVTL